jgi:hypothetical protein
VCTPQAANTKAIKTLFGIVAKLSTRLESCEKNVFTLKQELTEKLQNLEVCETFGAAHCDSVAKTCCLACFTANTVCAIVLPQ